MDDAPVMVFASFRPNPDAAAEVERLLRWMIEHTRAEEGCERYDLFREQGDRVAFHLFERYRDAAALEVHRATDHYVEYRRKILDLLAEPIEVHVLEVLDAQG